jgi:trimethylamine--corrinoid protein Co-methyltransferase
MIRSGHTIRATPEFRILSKSQLEDIHDASMEILSRTGVVIEAVEAVALLRKAGAFVEDGNRVRVPAHLVEWSVRAAPSNIKIYHRTGALAMDLGRRRTYFGTGSDTLAVIDPYTGERRQPLFADIADLARVCDALPNIDFVMSMGIASDRPWRSAELHDFYAMISNTVKPTVYTSTTLENSQRIVKMAETVAGGAEAFRQRPFGALYIEPISPLLFAQEPTSKLLFCAEKGIPCIFMSGMIGGATGPVTSAGSLALANAESLMGVLLSQLKREGAPVISGGGILTMDMSSAVASYGAPEFMLSSCALVEIAQYYGLPAWGYAGCSDSKVFDEQAAADAAQWVLLAALSGANLVHDVGYLESGLTSSFDMLVFTNEMIGKTKHLLCGIPVNAESLALDVIDRVGPGGEFLSDLHTLQHFRGNWFPTLEDRTNLEDWEARGCQDMRSRVRTRVQALLAEHQPQSPLCREVDEALQCILADADAQGEVG